MSRNPVKVAVLTTSFAKSETLMKELGDLGVEIVAKLCDAEVAVCGLEPINHDVLAANKGLRFVSKFGVGTDNLDFEALKAHGVEHGWTGGVNRRSVTELALAFMLGHSRNVTPSILRMKKGTWIKNGGVQLSNLTVGIVGLGYVGTDLARILRTMGSTVCFTDIVDKSVTANELGLAKMSYDELLQKSDIITFHVPSTPLTRNMFSTKQIEVCKRHALIVNTARGDIVDFQTTCNAVIEGRLGGFASDVYPAEPADMSHFEKFENLYFTPHIGGNAHEAVLAMGRSAISHVAEYLKKRGS